MRWITFNKLIIYGAAIVLFGMLPLFLPWADTVLVARSLLLAVAGLAFIILFTHTGMLSFGQSLFFGLGAYTAALLMKFWGIKSLELLLIASIAVNVLAGFGVGSISIRRGGIYFALLTLGFSQLLYSLYFKFYSITGGSDGIMVEMPIIAGTDFASMGIDRRVFVAEIYYYIILGFFVISLFIISLLINSPFGKTLNAIRDDPIRAEFSGINVYKFRLFSFVISGIFTGLAGTFWAFLPPFRVLPEFAYWTYSFDIVIIALLGGYQMFIGPIVGSFVYTFLKFYLLINTPFWQFILGAMIIVIALVFRGGIVGYIYKHVINRTGRLL